MFDVVTIKDNNDISNGSLRLKTKDGRIFQKMEGYSDPNVCSWNLSVVVLLVW